MLLGLKNASYRIGNTVLLDQANFSLESKERVALVGRNGTGKSTLFRVFSSEIMLEDGELVQRSGIKVGMLPQNVPEEAHLTIAEVVAQGLGQTGRACLCFEQLSTRNPDELSEEEHKALAEAQTYLIEHNAWHALSQIEQTLSKFQLDGKQNFAKQSGGSKRKVLLAQTLVNDPDVLLLDEPTNHLDIPSIELLEEQIKQFKGAVVLVSHDREFMRKLATRVCDLDRGILQSWPGGFDDYLKRKTDALAAEEKQNALFDKKLAQEEAWIRQGIKARRTRNEGRVRALKAMREQYANRREQSGVAKVGIEHAQQSGKKVMEIDSVSYHLGDQPLIKEFDNIVLRGEKIGLLGPNGIGKTTALKVFLGQLKPTSGKVTLGTNLEIAYFDQLRNQFNEQETAVEVIGAGKEYIEHNGKSKHVIGYLQEFLFSPERARQPVRSLSGGEKARLLLARLFATPSNLLVLDEPTNDLDIETLELIQEHLTDYTGTVLLVSHDREFIDQIVTRCWVFEGNGVIGDYVGGYNDWLRQRTSNPWDKQTESTSTKTKAYAQTNKKTKSQKLSYKDVQALKALPKKIEQLETEQTELLKKISDPTFYEQPAEQITAVNDKVKQLEQALAQAYEQWETLEQKGD